MKWTILIFIFFSLNSCTKNIKKRLPSSFEGNDVNIQFVKPQRRASDVLDIINLAVSSASYGYWMNHTLNGSGTMILRNPTEVESAPKQFNRFMSLFDLYFTHEVRKLESAKQNGNHYFWFYTPMQDFSFINTQEEYEFPLRKEVVDYAHRLFPIIEKQVFKSLSPDIYTFKKQNIRFKDEARKLILSEQKKRLQKNWEDIISVNENDGNIIEKLDAYRKAFSPLAALFELNFDKKKGSYQNIRLVLPGPSTIEGIETKNINKIKVTPGLDLKFKNPIVGKSITLNSATYLTQRDTNSLSNKVMQLDIHKNFKYTDKMKITVTFGSIDPDIKANNKRVRKENAKMLKALPLKVNDRSAALILDGILFLKDIPLKKLNKYLGKFQVRTYIHKIGLVLKREEKTKSFEEAFQNHPTYIMDVDTKNSLLSLRLTKGANTILHVKALVGLGFYCKAGKEREADPDFEILKGYKYTCLADLANFQDFDAKYQAKLGKAITRKILDISTIIEARNLIAGIDDLKPEDMFDSGMSYELFNILKTFTDAWDELRKIETPDQKEFSLEISI